MEWLKQAGIFVYYAPLFLAIGDVGGSLLDREHVLFLRGRAGGLGDVIEGVAGENCSEMRHLVVPPRHVPSTCKERI